MRATSPILRCELPYQADTAAAYTRILQLPWSALLDSVGADHAGRFDLLVCAPRHTLMAHMGQFKFDGEAHQPEPDSSLLWSWLRQHLCAGEVPLVGADVPFCGGLLGYFGYGLKSASQTDTKLGAASMPDLALGLYDGALLVDHAARRSCLVGLDDAHGRAWVQTMQEAIATTTPRAHEDFRLLAPPACQFARGDYQRAFDKVASYIRAGDCYQVNLAMRFTAPCEGSAWPLYLRLREMNPAPYSAWLNYPFGQVLSSSPEQFLALRSRQVLTRPIKGTRPRCADPTEDACQAQWLAESRKDQAENLMIVDLLRNDLGKVCVPGSVRVPELFKVEHFARVHHLVSTVTGRLAEDKDAFDLLAAAFPGGSITGAPKRRAMQIIAELEYEPRGVYCGAIGYVGKGGDMDLNIAIRTLTVKDGEVSFWVGSGLVADSDADAEYQECLDKASALLATLESFR